MSESYRKHYFYLQDSKDFSHAPLEETAFLIFPVVNRKKKEK